MSDCGPHSEPCFVLIRRVASTLDQIPGSCSPIPSRQILHCAVNYFRFLGFLLWFVLGPGSLREAPGGPGKAHGWPSGPSRGLPERPGPGSKNLKTNMCCRALLSGREFESARGSTVAIVRQTRKLADRERPILHCRGWLFDLSEVRLRP